MRLPARCFLVHARWPDAEQAENTAIMVLWLAEVVIYPAEPLLKVRWSPETGQVVKLGSP